MLASSPNLSVRTYHMLRHRAPCCGAQASSRRSGWACRVKIFMCAGCCGEEGAFAQYARTITPDHTASAYRQCGLQACSHCAVPLCMQVLRSRKNVHALLSSTATLVLGIMGSAVLIISGATRMLSWMHMDMCACCW